MSLIAVTCTSRMPWGVGGVPRRPHGVKLECQDVDDVGGIVVVVGEVNVDIEAGVVLGVVGMYAGDVVILDYHGI